MAHIYDMVIIGGGPGGYTAALYGARAGMDVLLLEKLCAGGQMALTDQIENYPGFPQGVDGFALARQMQQGAERFGAISRYGEVTAVDLKKDIKEVTVDGEVLFARTVVIATGANPRPLGVSEEQTLVGRGLSYCAHCDGMFYKDKVVAVVGGGDSAAAEALHLSKIAKKVIVVHRRDTLRATKVYHAPLLQAENVEFVWDSAVEEILHGDVVTGIRVRNLKTGLEQRIPCDGVFVSIGRVPVTDFLDGQLALDPGGYIPAGEDTEAGIPGVYAVGDVRTKALRQVVTAVADGAAAVHSAQSYLAETAG